MYRKKPAKTPSIEPSTSSGTDISSPSSTPSTGATATIATHRYVSRMGVWLASMKLTMPIPSLKRWTITTAAITRPSPPPTCRPAASATPSRKEWMLMPVAPMIPT